MVITYYYRQTHRYCRYFMALNSWGLMVTSWFPVKYTSINLRWFLNVPGCNDSILFRDKYLIKSMWYIYIYSCSYTYNYNYSPYNCKSLNNENYLQNLITQVTRPGKINHVRANYTNLYIFWVIFIALSVLS